MSHWVSDFPMSGSNTFEASDFADLRFPFRNRDGGVFGVLSHNVFMKENNNNNNNNNFFYSLKRKRFYKVIYILYIDYLHLIESYLTYLIYKENVNIS